MKKLLFYFLFNGIMLAIYVMASLFFVASKLDLGTYKIINGLDIRIYAQLANILIICSVIYIAFLAFFEIVVYRLNSHFSVNLSIHFFKIKKEIPAFMLALISFAIVIFLIAINLIGVVQKNYFDQKKVFQMRETLSKSKYIIHAGGYADDGSGNNVPYTNSYEAFMNFYSSGNYFCELDLSLTTDNSVVCVHDWDQLYSNGKALTGAVSLEEFLNCKVYNLYTTISLEDVADYIARDSRIHIITDVKDDNIEVCKIIAEQYPNLLDNFIVQIYEPSEYNEIKALGFDYIIYTLYRQEPEYRTLKNISYAVSHMDLVAITCWYYIFDDEYFNEILNETDTAVCIHTVNESEMCQEYFDRGVLAIYTDDTSLW